MALKLADFETIRDLGAGSFGSVKLVRRRDDGVSWAMKTVSLCRLNQKDKDNALNEVRLLASIDIPNVIAYRACFFDQDSNSLCIVMEYADGGDLQVRIERCSPACSWRERTSPQISRRSTCGKSPTRSCRD
jgi:NIMA (never in mitosis gene a)-related kinase